MEPGLPCVHCGLCLNTCPTYRVLGTEADSPRGRIYLMEAVIDGSLDLDDQVVSHLDGCLGCLACETACPSGVSFGHRIERFRPRLRRGGVRGAWRTMVARVASSHRLLRAGMMAAAAMDAAGLARPRRRMPGLGVLPARIRSAQAGRAHRGRESRASPRPALRAALLRGCVADVLRPQISDAAVEVLERHDVEVVELPESPCCGALALHAGRRAEGLALARAMVSAFASVEADVLVTTAAGCGAVTKDYGRLLADDPSSAEAARRLAERSRDVSELLVECGLREPDRPLAHLRTVRYHDACHLLHAEGISMPPRALIAAATGVLPTDLGENTICCGSAGSYNLDNPAMGLELGRRKGELIKASAAQIVAVGNVGCILQLERAIALAGLNVSVRHPVELLAQAYRQADPGVAGS